MHPLEPKAKELVLLERRYNLTRWGNKFDDQHAPDDWRAFASKELYNHRSGDEPPQPVYLWPERMPDVSFMLAMAGTGAALLSHLESDERQSSPSVSAIDPMVPSRRIINQIPNAPEKENIAVNSWLNDLNDSISTAYISADTKNQLYQSLSDIVSAIITAETDCPGLLDEAISVTKKRVLSAQPHEGVSPVTPTKKIHAAATAQITEYTPTDEDFTRVGDRLTRFTLGVGGPDYNPIPVAFKAVVDEVCVGDLIGTSLWGRMEVNLLEVDEAHRGKGIGSQLLAAAEEFSKRNEIGGIHLWTPTWQGEGFYEKRGYVKAAGLPLYIKPPFGTGKEHIIYHKEWGISL